MGGDCAVALARLTTNAAIAVANGKRSPARSAGIALPLARPPVWAGPRVAAAVVAAPRRAVEMAADSPLAAEAAVG